jgi:L-ascorbate metabolism protein UlaG (beta-lactamase superfamily)
LPHVTLRKTGGPALSPAQIGRIDAVLLSHDQHADNLDHSGRAFLPTAGRIFTTQVGASRLGGYVEGLAPWQSVEILQPDRRTLRITGTPARHGPAGIEPFSGGVIGFALTLGDRRPIYITGDTVWFSGVAEVARRFHAGLVLPFAGAAQTRGPFHLTMSTNDVIEVAHSFLGALIVPVHCEGRAHLTQGRNELHRAFTTLGIDSRLRLLGAGESIEVEGPA